MGKAKKHSLDTNSNNDEVSIIMMVMCIQLFFSLRNLCVCVYIYILVCSLCLKDRDSTSCEHVCVCTSVQVAASLKSVCNLYIIENEREMVSVCSGLDENWLHGNYYNV